MLFFVQYSFGQTSSIDSLKEISKSAKEDTVKLAALVQLEGLLAVQDDLIINLDNQLKLATKLKNFKVVAKALKSLGWYKYVNQQFAAADSLYHQSLAISQQYNYPEVEGSAYTALMMLYWWQGKTKEAVAYFEKAETMLQKAGNKPQLGTLYLNASALYENIKFFDQALIYAKKSYDYASLDSDSSRLTMSMAFLGNAYINAGKNLEGLTMLNNAMVMAGRTNDQYSQGDINFFLGEYYYGQNDYLKAISYCNKALNIFANLHVNDRMISALDMLADAYFYNRDFDKAKKAVLDEMQLTGGKDNMTNRYIYKKLANIDLVNNDLGSWKKDIGIADSLEALYTSAEVKKAVLDINTKYQTSLKEKQILGLQRQKDIQKIFIIGLAISLAAIVIVGFLMYRYINQKKLIAEQKNIQLEQEKQLVAVNSILEGQETERTRMARDLHDGLGSMLSGIKLNLSAVKGNMVIKEKDALLFSKSITQLDIAITEMRRVAHNMMPEALLKFGLPEAVQDFCDGINESNTVRMRFTHLELEERLSKSVEVTLYRIIQELSNNAIKHAAAKNIFLQLSRHEKGITLTVEDDGNGFDSAAVSAGQGQGLKNVQSRIDYLKGSYDIRSEKGNGTSINIEIPV